MFLQNLNTEGVNQGNSSSAILRISFYKTFKCRYNNIPDSKSTT